MGKMIFNFSIQLIILVALMLGIVSQRSKISNAVFDIFVILIGCSMFFFLIMFLVKIIKRN